MDVTVYSLFWKPWEKTGGLFWGRHVESRVELTRLELVNLEADKPDTGIASHYAPNLGELNIIT